MLEDISGWNEIWDNLYDNGFVEQTVFIYHFFIVLCLM